MTQPSEDKRRQAVELYQSGQSMREVAAAVGRSLAWVGQQISAADLSRPRGGEGRRPDLEHDRSRAVALFRSGLPYGEVAAQLGRNRKFVRRAVLAAGVEVPRGQQSWRSNRQIADPV